MARLAERLPENAPFTRVLPGHGETFCTDSPAARRKELEKCVAWMKTQ